MHGDLKWLWQGVTVGVVISVIHFCFMLMADRWLRWRQVREIRFFLHSEYGTMLAWENPPPSVSAGTALGTVFRRVVRILDATLTHRAPNLSSAQTSDLLTILDDAKAFLEFAQTNAIPPPKEISRYDDLFFDKIENLKWLRFRKTNVVQPRESQGRPAPRA